MADSIIITANVTDGAIINSNVTESTAVTANVVTGAKGDKGDTGATGAAGVVQAVTDGTGIDVDATDPASPIVSLDPASIASLALADSAIQSLSDLSITSTAAELNYTDGVTSAIQTQLDGKSATSHTHTAADTTDFDTEVSNNTDVAANTAARHTHANSVVLDATTASFTTADETKLDGIAIGAQVNTVTSVNTRTGAVTGLAEASDLTAHTGNTSNPHSVTKAQVGLGNVDNTADANKPVSTATQTALDGKFTQRTITGTTNQVTVTNGDGVSGNPTLSLPQDIHTGASPTFAGLTTNGSINLPSSRTGGDDDGVGTDSTSRLNLYAYQRAHTNSFGENIRHYMMYKDAKSMDTWYFPDGGYDGSRLPVGTFKPVVWTGAHWEADDHGSLHKHWSVETPDSTGAIQTRFEVRFGDTSNNGAIAGLNKTLIATNLADFAVRNSNGQKFILSASDADGSDRVILFSKDAEGLDADRIWKIKTEGGATADLGIVRYNSSGVLQDQPFTIARSNGQITIGGSSGTSSGLVVNRNGGTALSIAQTGAGGTVINATGIDTNSQSFGTRVSGDASGRYAVYTNGLMEWGSGAASRDTNLYRSAADTLKTDDSFTIGGNLTISDAKNIVLNTTTGTKIGTATTQKLSVWNATPIVQPTTAIAASTLAGGGGTALTDTHTIDGYTLLQVVKALRNIGLLA